MLTLSCAIDANAESALVAINAAPEPTVGDLRMPTGYGLAAYARNGLFRNPTCQVREGIPDAANLTWRSSIPRPIFDADPTLVTLYNKAWELSK